MNTFLGFFGSELDTEHIHVFKALRVRVRSVTQPVLKALQVRSGTPICYQGLLSPIWNNLLILGLSESYPKHLVCKVLHCQIRNTSWFFRLSESDSELPLILGISPSNPEHLRSYPNPNTLAGRGGAGWGCWWGKEGGMDGGGGRLVDRRDLQNKFHGEGTTWRTKCTEVATLWLTWPMVLVLLSAYVKRFSVAWVRDFFKDIKIQKKNCDDNTEMFKVVDCTWVDFL